MSAVTGSQAAALAPLRPARKAVEAARADYRRADEAAGRAMGHLLSVWPQFSRADLRRDAGGTRRLHHRLMGAHAARQDREIPLWEITDEERQAAYADAVAAVLAVLEAKAVVDARVADRQDVVRQVRESTRATLPLSALAEPSGLSYQWLLKLDHR